MIKNYIKIAFRSMLRHKQVAVINILGLSVGMTACILILLYVKDELSYDQFHEHAERIYRVAGAYDQGGEVKNRSALTTYPLASLLETNFQAIEKTVRINNGGAFVKYGEQQYPEENVYFVDSTFFDVFSFPLLEGDASTALDHPQSVVISQTMAKKYFGSAEEARGKMLTFFDSVAVMVTGVMEDIPHNSHLRTDFLLSMRTVEPLYPEWILKGWGPSHYTYILLSEGQQAEGLEKQINQYLVDNWGEEAAKDNLLFLQPFTRIYLTSQLTSEISTNGDIRYVTIFSVVGLLILLIACINYMNLATAYAMRRSKEVLIRKTIGALKKQLIFQFLSEAILTAIVAFFVAGLMAELSMPVFRQMTGKDIALNFLGNYSMMISLLLIALGVGVAAGSYPAMMISSFDAGRLLKGTSIKIGGSHLMRKSLVVFQFFASIALSVAAIIIFNQLHFLRNEKLGINPEQIVLLPLQTEEITKQYEVLKNRLLEDTRFAGVTASNNVLTSRVTHWRQYRVDSAEQEVQIPTIIVEHDFFKTLEAKIVEGRDFSEDFPSDRSEAYIINETARKFLGLETPIGTPIVGSVFTGRGSEWSKKNAKIIGVVEDFHFASLHSEIQPVVFSLRTEKTTNIGWVAVRIQQDIPGAVQYLQEVWNEIAPERSLQYSFMDEDIDNLYVAEERFLQIFTIFSGLAIFIACLGIFGLASFIAVQRTKEIGVRKVLGASIAHLVILLSKDFTLLVCIAFFIAVPAAYLTMSSWLQDFAYKINIGIGAFIIAGIGSLLIAWLTVSYQAIKAAMANPVDSLRNE